MAGCRPVLQWVLFAGWGALTSLALTACGDEFETAPACPGDASVPCNEDPWNCPEGQTCWFTTAGMECLNAQSTGAEGSPCDPLVGSPTCGEGMVCAAFTETDGVCRRYCDTTEPCKACPNGFVCNRISFGAAGAHICLPP